MNILHNDVYVESLIRELGELIENAQRQVAVTANAAAKYSMTFCVTRNLALHAAIWRR